MLTADDFAIKLSIHLPREVSFADGANEAIGVILVPFDQQIFRARLDWLVTFFAPGICSEVHIKGPRVVGGAKTTKTFKSCLSKGIAVRMWIKNHE